MTARADVAARRCSTCALRPGTAASRCDETRQLLEEARERFVCHAARRRGRCAGAVATYGTDEDMAAFLARPPEVVHAFVAVLDRGACGHEHPTVADAWTCAQASGEATATVGRMITPDAPWFFQLDDDDAAELARLGGRVHPPYYVAVHRTEGECQHAHPTIVRAWLCALDSSGYESMPDVHLHQHWPWQTGDDGERVPDDELNTALSAAFPEVPPARKPRKKQRP